MVTSVDISEYEAGSGQIYLEYIMSALESALSSTISSVDSALNGASLVVRRTPFERGIEGGLEDPYVPEDVDAEVNIPAQIKSGNVASSFSRDLTGMLNGLVSDGVAFVETFFPPISALETSVCTKLRNMLAGTSNYDEAAFTDRGLSSAQKEALAHEGLITELVSTGSVAAPTDIVRAVTYYGGAQLSLLSNNQILLHIPRLFEDLSFAFESVAEYRSNVTAAILGYVTSAVQAAGAASDASAAWMLNAQPALISAVAGYRNAMLGFEELKVQARTAANTTRAEVSKAKSADTDTLARVNIRMLLDQAQAYASKVAAALNGISVSGGAMHLVRG